MNPPEATYEVNYDTELFVDDVLIAERFGVTRNLHPATKLDAPVIISPNPASLGNTMALTKPNGFIFWGPPSTINR
ncbi:hypothetical protein CMK12_12310 [Candidatus Poribacteria bacterium]|nr:hypothetical protein [Candidatus Poribacteria bacterium]